MPPHVLPPGHGRSVTDFWVWDAPMRRSYVVPMMWVVIYIGGCSARRALKPKFYQPTQTMVTAWILPFRENSHGRAGNRTRDLMISSQRLWPLDHEACRVRKCNLLGIWIDRFLLSTFVAASATAGFLCVQWGSYYCLIWSNDRCSFSTSTSLRS